MITTIILYSNCFKFFCIFQAELAAIGQTVVAAQANKKDASDKMEAIRMEFAELEKKRSVNASGVREIQVCVALSYHLCLL